MTPGHVFRLPDMGCDLPTNNHTLAPLTSSKHEYVSHELIVLGLAFQHLGSTMPSAYHSLPAGNMFDHGVRKAAKK
jgi:hypothetical protein